MQHPEPALPAPPSPSPAALRAALATSEALLQMSSQLELLAMALDELAHESQPALRQQVAAVTAAAIDKARGR
ncbi:MULTISPECIES: hypothetical protein [Aquincola]|uniref:hypothetical protein n=1 Tax=Aquincola TaxID=391952 RepID=UPI00061520F9|nr:MULTISPECIES: hypothetical protein [Aquincola]MCR5868552.1 hypothetical protein [Aquincola sp. J276]